MWKNCGLRTRVLDRVVVMDAYMLCSAPSCKCCLGKKWLEYLKNNAERKQKMPRYANLPRLLERFFASKGATEFSIRVWEDFTHPLKPSSQTHIDTTTDLNLNESELQFVLSCVGQLYEVEMPLSPPHKLTTLPESTRPSEFPPDPNCRSLVLIPIHLPQNFFLSNGSNTWMPCGATRGMWEGPS